MQYDTLIRNALVIDGSDRPGYNADVAIRGGRIERIGDLGDTRAIEDVDFVAASPDPGFVPVRSSCRGMQRNPGHKA